MNTLYETKPFRGIKGSCKTISGGHFFDEGEDHCMWCGKEEKKLKTVKVASKDVILNSVYLLFQQSFMTTKAWLDFHKFTNKRELEFMAVVEEAISNFQEEMSKYKKYDK